MWTPENRKLYDRSDLRYPSDVTDEEWELIKPQIAPAKHGGRKRAVDEREIVNAIMYVLSTGCQWRALRRIFRREARCGITSICGATMARLSASITSFT
jgi:transposase